MNSIKKYLLTISYDGSSFAGWQTQSNALSIQTAIEHALSMILRSPITLHGSGRTDSGVHALAQTAHFEFQEPFDQSNLVYRLNCVLPQSIRILKLHEVNDDFHARFSVRKKTYAYKVFNYPIMDPFLLNKAWHVSFHLDFDLMKKAACKIQGEHDFKAFAAKNTQGPASVDSHRFLESFTIEKQGHLIIFELTAKGFLYKMVRNIVGTVIEIGSGKLPISSIDQALLTGQRELLGPTAPPSGLYLKQVEY